MEAHESMTQVFPERRSISNGLRLQSYLLAALSLGMAAFLLFHFGCIWMYGQVLVIEPDPRILMGEIIGAVIVLMFSVYCLVDYLGRTTHKG